MPAPRGLPLLGSLALIAIVIGVGAAAFAYTAGWFSPRRLTPDKLVAAFAPPSGPSLGHRRNHAKGICFTGVFEANGAGSELSRAQVFARGQYPVVGRFNLGTPDADAADATVRVRGLGISIATPDGQEWRSAMINPPVFAVSTPRGFYELLRASHSKDPNAMNAFAAAHPEFATFGAWAKNGPWTGSYAEERYNGLNSFVFIDGSGTEHVVRWSLLPAAQPVAVSPDELGDGRQSGRSDRRPHSGLAARSPHARGRHARGGARPGRARWPVPRHQFRSGRAALRHTDVR
jgi:catalase